MTTPFISPSLLYLGICFIDDCVFKFINLDRIMWTENFFFLGKKKAVNQIMVFWKLWDSVLHWITEVIWVHTPSCQTLKHGKEPLGYLIVVLVLNAEMSQMIRLVKKVHIPIRLLGQWLEQWLWCFDCNRSNKELNAQQLGEDRCRPHSIIKIY